MTDHRTLMRARALRKGPNMPEALLWNVLKSKKLEGHKFVRQYPLGPFIADFCCRRLKLVIELDGSQHVDSDYDRRRDQYMQQQGYAVLRFWSHAVLTNMNGVVETILFVLRGGHTEGVVEQDLKFAPWKREPLRQRFALPPLLQAGEE